jgi:hypothetical protein
MDAKTSSLHLESVNDGDRDNPDLEFLAELDTLLDEVFSGNPSPDTPINARKPQEEDYREDLQGIFRLAVKDHLRPVVTYVSYLNRQQQIVESLQGLVNILPPIIEAAGEVGMGDFAGVLERIYALVSPLLEGTPEALDEATLREINLNLSSLPAMLELAPGDSLQQAISADRDFERLSQILYSVRSLTSENIHKLFRAGLTTVRSLLGNRSSEIVDVTGIDAATVETMVEAVRNSTEGQAILSTLNQQRTTVSLQQLKAIEVKLTQALRIREKLADKLARQRTLIQQIRRENAKLESYLTALAEKLQTLQLAEAAIDQEDRGTPEQEQETQRLRIRIRSIRRQIEEITKHSDTSPQQGNVLLAKISRLQKRYQRFVADEEAMISDLELNEEQLTHLRKSISAVKKDLAIKQARQR